MPEGSETERDPNRTEPKESFKCGGKPERFSGGCVVKSDENVFHLFFFFFFFFFFVQCFRLYFRKYWQLPPSHCVTVSKWSHQRSPFHVVNVHSISFLSIYSFLYIKYIDMAQLQSRIRIKLERFDFNVAVNLQMIAVEFGRGDCINRDVIRWISLSS